MATLGEARGSATGEVTSVTPMANTRTRRSRNYRTRKGSIAPKDVMPKNLNSIGWRDEDDNEIFTRRTLSLTLDQLRAVCGQLGYLPLNIVSIGASSKDLKSSGAPQVAILYPLALNKLVRQGREYKRKKQDKLDAEQEVDGNAAASKEGDESHNWDPFPTTCWLTCPKLHARICKLEDKGWISKLESKLQNSDKFTKQMERAHQAYIDYRWALLSPRDRRMVESVKWDKMLKSVGIAGIRVFNAVKCLHCHYAHYLSRPEDGNVVGAWIDELLREEINSEADVIPEEAPAPYRGSPRSRKSRLVNDSYRDEVNPISSGSGTSSDRDYEDDTTQSDGGTETGTETEGTEADPPVRLHAIASPDTKNDSSISGGPFHSPLPQDTIPPPDRVAKSPFESDAIGQEEAEETCSECGSDGDNEGSLIESTISYISGSFSWKRPGAGEGHGDREGERGSEAEVDDVEDDSRARTTGKIPVDDADSVATTAPRDADFERMCAVFDCTGMFTW